MARLHLLGIGCLLLSGCGTGEPIVRRAESRIELAPCLLADASGNRSIRALCGSWTVPENRRVRGGRLLNLKLAVVEAVSRNPAPFPVMILAGGPGQAATEVYSGVRAAFSELARTHDFVLIDQRGTGGSNPLRCPDLKPEELVRMDDAVVADRFIHCRDALPADVSQYTTQASVQDFEEIRQALGYPQVHLYGASYGTRVGLAYLRRYPGSIRTAVLDGVVPPSLALGANIAPDAQRALDRMFERCRRDPRCGERFPALESRFDEVLKRLRRGPVRVTLDHPRRGTPIELDFTAAMFAVAVRLLSYSPETVALLPLLIESAAAGRWQPVAAQFLLVTDTLNRSISEVMGFSVSCTEDYPFFEPEELARLGAGTYLGESQTRAMSELCAGWPRGEIPDDFRAPVRADVPVLLLSGENDPVTPPAYGEEVAAMLPRALHVTVPAMGHNVLSRGCIPSLVTQFVQAETTEDLGVGCVSQVRPAPFFVSFSGSVQPGEAP